MRRGLRLQVGKPQAQDQSAKHLLCFQLRSVGLIAFETEHFFARPFEREHRWDIAFVTQRLAVEVDGGIWIQGAHAHPTTILRNMLKRNLGACLGWRVLAFDPDQVKSGEAVRFVEFTLKGDHHDSIHGKPPSLSIGRARRRHAAPVRSTGG
jgi:hypothetical protein